MTCSTLTASEQGGCGSGSKGGEGSRRLTTCCWFCREGEREGRGPRVKAVRGVCVYVIGVVHPWVGQKLLKCNGFKSYSRLRGTDESGDAALLSEATADLS